MNYIFHHHGPTDAQVAEYQADIQAVLNFIDGLDEGQLYALGLVMAACMQDGGNLRAVHYHGQVVALKRTKFDLCACGGFHKSIEHGVNQIEKEVPPEPQREVTLDDELLRRLSRLNVNLMCDGSVHCARCNTEYRSIEHRESFNHCQVCNWSNS